MSQNRTYSGLLVDPVQQQAADEMAWKIRNIPGWLPAHAALGYEVPTERQPVADKHIRVQDIVNDSYFPPANG